MAAHFDMLTSLLSISISASDSILVNSERVLAYSEVYEHTLRPTNKRI